MKNFSETPEDRIAGETEFFLIIRDAYPVSPGHCLVVSRRVTASFFELSEDEKGELVHAIDEAKMIIEEDYSPDGYNIGMNCGVAAGQSVMHFHCHVIPRYRGDMDNPKGGVRYCIPDKGFY